MQGVGAYLGLIRAREMLRYAILSEENIKKLSGCRKRLSSGSGLSYEELQIKAQLARAHGAPRQRGAGAGERQEQLSFVFQADIADSQIDSLLLPAMPGAKLPANLDAAVEQALDGTLYCWNCSMA
jgi:adhesin transport system outer membrane protein